MDETLYVLDFNEGRIVAIDCSDDDFANIYGSDVANLLSAYGLSESECDYMWAESGLEIDYLSKD